MGFFDGYNISTSGMSAQRARINVVSANLANAQTTNTIDGGPYKKQNIVFQEVLLKEQERSANPHATGDQSTLRGVGVKTVLESKGNPVMRYEPHHPDANEKGYVAYPDINPVVEMTDLIEAMRTYESNIAAFQTHKNMDAKTLEILKA
ncbi:flagellar basal body rod protein FlgC [Arcobacter sp. FWKO B]|uniref:flagellar basal body rod protein FlgC n=1 Tax=Arcobacter sp. FWKO B TaxID=2593672 RepID=UPI0018A4FF14|nr:flagellar basal body rod protein FlgC [Arcobacter sp. FWKO B]QOG12005.1 flagellar basal body rod protein FlgC [Arcobacter sp. FWKO B]